mgnify:CR=1 FL=1
MTAYSGIGLGWIDELRASALMEQGKTAEEILKI